MNTKIRMREQAQVFACANGEMAHAHIARLAALYEDLRIENFAMVEAAIPVLDSTDERYRQNYFLRRSVATLLEFAEAIRLLNDCPDFQATQRSFNQEIRRYWDKGVRFFFRRERFFKDIRNDIGGHFGSKAAIYAIKNVDPEAVGKIEMRSDKTVRLHFAGELVATATLKHVFGLSVEHKVRRLIRIALLGYRHATRCCHCIAACYLWERFGR